MKKTFLKSAVLAIAGVGLLAGSALATPIFNGDPYADFGVGDVDNLTAAAINNDTGAGYYIWANDASRTSWSVRWTGGDWSGNTTTLADGRIFADDYGSYSWAGDISYSNADGIQSVSLVEWDSGDGTVVVDDGLFFDVIDLDIATAGPHWDGFDFTLNGDYGDYLTFNLGSTFFTSDNDGIYLGQGLVSVLDYSDSIVDFRNASGNLRQFEAAAPVPEPATMLLFGTGLAGLAGFARRKKAQKK